MLVIEISNKDLLKTPVVVSLTTKPYLTVFSKIIIGTYLYAFSFLSDRKKLMCSHCLYYFHFCFQILPPLNYVQISLMQIMLGDINLLSRLSLSDVVSELQNLHFLTFQSADIVYNYNVHSSLLLSVFCMDFVYGGYIPNVTSYLIVALSLFLSVFSL